MFKLLTDLRSRGLTFRVQDDPHTGDVLLCISSRKKAIERVIPSKGFNEQVLRSVVEEVMKEFVVTGIDKK